MTSREKFEENFPVPIGAAFDETNNEYVFVGGVHHLQRCREYQEKWLVWQARDAEIEAARKEGFAAGLQAAVDEIAANFYDNKNCIFDCQQVIHSINQLQPADYKVVKAEEYEALRKPLAVSVARMEESNGKVWFTVYLLRDDSQKIWNGYPVYQSTVEGRANYEADRLKHFLGQGEAPNIIDYDTDLPSQAIKESE